MGATIGAWCTHTMPPHITQHRDLIPHTHSATLTSTCNLLGSNAHLFSCVGVTTGDCSFACAFIYLDSADRCSTAGQIGAFEPAFRSACESTVAAALAAAPDRFARMNVLVRFANRMLKTSLCTLFPVELVTVQSNLCVISIVALAV